jgi:hypothetical protein
LELIHKLILWLGKSQLFPHSQTFPAPWICSCWLMGRLAKRAQVGQRSPEGPTFGNMPQGSRSFKAASMNMLKYVVESLSAKDAAEARF